MAILLTTSTALATPVSTPLGCHNGTREEAVPPTVIPGYTEVVPDIYHEGWIEDVPDIQHDGWIEVTPDIIHEGYLEIVPDIEHPAVTQHIPGPDKTRWEVFGQPVCVYPNGWHNISLKADCLTMWDTKSMAGNAGGGSKKLVIPGYTEVVPDIEHEAWTEEVPDIDHGSYIEVTPDIEHPAYTEVVEDIWHPEQVIENPPLVIDTKTIKYKDVTILPRPPFIEISFHYETTDGTCHN